MSIINAPKYSFVSELWPEETFTVIDFQGTEGLSLCYRFEINLVSTKSDIDLKKTMQRPAVFTIHREDGDLPFHGILTQLSIHQAYQEYVFYRAVLTPKFWWLDMTTHNQVFLNMTAPDILRAVLEDGGLTAMDYELRLQNDYPEWEYICQYGETHHDFACRWMEREGIYYFFEQQDYGEKLILTDTKLAHVPMPQGRTLYYSPPSGLDSAHGREIIHSLFCRQSLTPQRVKVKDYNYRTPSLNLWGEAEVSPELGRGEFYAYGEHFRTTEEGGRLASIMAESLLCREQVFAGQSGVPYFRPGYIFHMQGHFREEFNQEYLTTEVRHQGSQVGYLTAGLRKAFSAAEKEPAYHNHFTIIPARLQFRPERKTPKARFYGSMNAKIDASGDGRYAELDEHGRYKVILPFDLSGRENGKASTWLRMMQPYGGEDHGMHFPLHKGSEVLLTFIDGDPDRPIITGAVPNTNHPSPVNTANQTSNRITTAGQNKIHMEDQEGSQRIQLQTPSAGTVFRIGSPNETENEGENEADSEVEDMKEAMEAGKAGVLLSTKGPFKVECASCQEMIMGHELKIVLGASETVMAGNDLKMYLLYKNDTILGNSLEISIGPAEEIKVGEAQELGTFKTIVYGKREEILGSDTQIAAEESHLKAKVSKVMASYTGVIAEQNKVMAEEQTKVALAMRTMGQRMQNVAQIIEQIGRSQRNIVDSEDNVVSSEESIAKELKTVAQSMINAGTYNCNIGTSNEIVGQMNII